MDVENNDTLGSLESAFRNAVAELVQAEKATAIARTAETEALNRVNDIQKRIDAKIAAIRSEPHLRQTDWGRNRFVKVQEA
jgi:hypothetical protein